MYHVFSNRIIRVIVCILLVCVFFIVPSEHKMLEAGAAFTASIAISVICAVLVAMGFTFGRAFLSDGSDAAFSKYSRTFAINSMRDLATDIFNAHSAEILSLLAYSFPGGMPNVTGANIIVMIAPALYTLVKKYIVNRFGNTSDEIEDGLNKTYGYVGNPFSYNGYVFSHYNSDKNVILGYPCYGSVSIGNKSFYWDFVKVTDSGLYTYKAFYANGDSLKSLNTWTSYDSSSYSVVLTYRDIIAPNSEHEYGVLALMFIIRFVLPAMILCLQDLLLLLYLIFLQRRNISLFCVLLPERPIPISLPMSLRLILSFLMLPIILNMSMLPRMLVIILEKPLMT